MLIVLIIFKILILLFLNIILSIMNVHPDNQKWPRPQRYFIAVIGFFFFTIDLFMCLGLWNFLVLLINNIISGFLAYMVSQEAALKKNIEHIEQLYTAICAVLMALHFLLIIIIKIFGLTI